MPWNSICWWDCENVKSNLIEFYHIELKIFLYSSSVTGRSWEASYHQILNSIHETQFADGKIENIELKISNPLLYSSSVTQAPGRSWGASYRRLLNPIWMPWNSICWWDCANWNIKSNLIEFNQIKSTN